MASSSASNSQHQQQQSRMFRESVNAEASAGSSGQQHAILRISSAHGPRDSVQHLQHNANAAAVNNLGQKVLPSHNAPNYQQIPGQQQQHQQQQQQTTQQRSTISDFPTASPPVYQQAVNANSNEFGKFSSTRKSPESRAVQAVPPFGVREIANAIPDECQIVKQLVRDVVSGQLSSTTASNSSITSTSMSPVAVLAGPGQSLQPVEAYMPPPAYNLHQRLQQTNSHKQQSTNAATEISSSHGQQSVAHPLLTVSTQQQQQQQQYQHSTGGVNLGLPPSPKDNVGAAPRMSLSHPDLTRLQNLPSNASANSSSSSHQQQTTTKMHPLLAAQQNQQLMAPNLETSVYEVSNVPLPSDVLPPPPTNMQRYSHVFSASPMPSSSSRFYDGNANMEYGHGFMGPSGAVNFANVEHQRMDVQNIDIERRTTARMLEQLAQDNKNLRNELEGYIKKTYKLQQLELQYQKIQREYEELVRKADKREHLQDQMQKRMQQELARLTEINSQLTEQLDAAVAQITQYHIVEAEDGELRHEITRRERMLTELITQNKALIGRNESQAKELQEQEATLEAQRTHISILDKALSNAQEKNLKLDEECKKKAAFVQRCEKLQQLVNKLQDSGQKREDTHKRNIAHLQKELTQLQIAKKSERERSGNLSEVDETKLAKLKRELQDKDEQIFSFQQESLRYQNMYYEEMKRRETAVEEASDTKEVRIKVLEECCDKTEKRVEAALNETKKYAEELRLCRSQKSELENQKEMLEAKLAELEAFKNISRRRLQAVGGNLPSSMELSFDGRTPKSPALFSLSESYSGTSSEETKKLLDVRRRCLLMSPSPSRYPKYYQKHKFTSIDASFNLDTSKSLSDYGSLGRNTARRQNSTSAVVSNDDEKSVHHNRTQSSCESSYLSGLNSASSFGHSPSTSSPLAEREIFTLPTRRSRTKILNVEQGKPIRPRSADDHLLSTEDNEVFNRNEQKDISTPNKLEERADVAAPINNEGDSSSEQLWDV